MKMSFVPAALVLCAGAGASAQTPQYRVTLLPPIETPAGPMQVGGRAMNDLGWVVGEYSTQAFGDPYGYRVALYRPGEGWVDIGHPGDLVTLTAADLNNAGLIVGTAATRLLYLGSAGQTWSWQAGQFNLYPQLVPGRIAGPGLTNEAGRLVGSGNDGSFATNKALEFLPPSTTRLLLPGVPGGNSALDVNNNGVILGTELLGVFLWAPGQPRWYFPPPPGLPYVEFNAINDRNDAVAMARAAGHTETQTAVVWLDGAGWTALPRNARRCNARRINNLREVIGTSQDNAGAIGDHAWYWRPGMGSITPLEQLIADPPGIYAVGWASDINERGQILAGISVRATGQGHQAILTPIITAPLQLDLVSNTPPAMQAPGQPLRVDLRILDGTQTYVAGSAQAHYRTVPAAPFTTTPLQSAGGGIYTAMLPAAACGDMPQFYFTAAASGGGTVSLPAGAPATAFSTTVGALTTSTLLAESFESGSLPAGWSATGLWNVTTACLTDQGFCYDGGVTKAYYGIPGQCNFDTGGQNAGVLSAPVVQLPVVSPGGEIRLTYCTSLLFEQGGSARAGLYINGVLRDTPSWTSMWERRIVDLTAYAGQAVSLEWRFDSGGIFGLTERGWHVDNIRLTATSRGCKNPPCYANCDGSTAAPVLNINDFTCFLNRFAAGESYANCDGSSQAPVLNVNDFVCFQQRFAAGCP